MKQLAARDKQNLLSLDIAAREDFFKEAEARLNELVEEFDRSGRSLESFVGSQVPKIKKLEQAVNQLLDIAILDLHLGKMEADDLILDLVARINEFVRKLNLKMYELRWETSEALKALSDACLHLKVKVRR